MELRSLLLLFRHLTIRTIEKGEVLIQEGDTKKEVYYTRRGLVRSYFITEKGDEITFQLFPEYRLFGNIHSILFDEPSSMYFEALEPTKVYSMDYESFHDLASKHPQLLKTSRMNLNQMVVKQAYQRVEAFVLLSPEERYLKYMEDYPNLYNGAPDKYIANVLGITPVSLSRIKGRIMTKKT